MLHQYISCAEAVEALYQPRVYSYARWSTPEQAKGDSFRRQNDAARKWAEKRGLKLDESLRITDEGVSAYRGGNALDGGLSRFLDACRGGRIEPGSFLLVESLDRISRMAPRKAQRLVDDIVDNGVTIVTLNDDQHYTAERLDNDPTALLISLMVAWRAHDESKSKGRRVAAAWQEKRRLVRENPAVRLTRRAPSWLRPAPDGGWEIDGAKAATVQRIFTLTIAGEGENKIAAKFNVEGVPPLGRGRHWHRTSVAKILRNPAVIGTLQPGFIKYEGGRRLRVLEEPVPNAFPPVIGETDWLAARALKSGRTPGPRGRHAGKGVAHVFAGLARCPACGNAMTRVNKGSGKKAGTPKLVCADAKGKAGCRYRTVSVEAVEEAFISGWGNLFADVPADDPKGELEDLHAGLRASIEGREDHLADLSHAADAAPSATLARSIARAEAELNTLRAEAVALDELRLMADRGLINARLEQLHGLLDPEPAADGKTPEIDRTATNALLKVLFKGVVVDYESGFLRFQWAQGGEAGICYEWPR